jgi:predicted dithiol-disulfide oxidoreductase (DUF899 family)
MTKHKTGTHEEWLAARRELLKKEKELTRRSDEITRLRQELPWVRIDKEYQFKTDEGNTSLKNLFQGRSQLLIYHFMFGPDYDAGCASCSSIADGFDGCLDHLANHDVMLCAVSRAPIEKLHSYKQRMGWSFPWVSSFGSDFNFDFRVSFTEEQQREGSMKHDFSEDNVSSQSDNIDAIGAVPEAAKKYAAGTGTDWATYIREAPGMSAFALEDGVVYHTYSAYERGLDSLWNMYQWLDRAPLGRNETGFWLRRHDEYEIE